MKDFVTSFFFFLYFKKINLFILFYFWLRWAFSCGARASHCGGCSCFGAWALGTWGSVVVARGVQ